MIMKSSFQLLLLYGLLVFAASCAGPKTMTLSYENPVWDGYLADPHVLYTKGVYYACGTGLAEDGRHFPILKSTDFVTWEYVGGALAPLTDPDLKLYWAPEIAEHNGKYYLYYAGDMKMWLVHWSTAMMILPSGNWHRSWAALRRK